MAFYSLKILGALVDDAFNKILKLRWMDHHTRFQILKIFLVKPVYLSKLFDFIFDYLSAEANIASDLWGTFYWICLYALKQGRIKMEV